MPSPLPSIDNLPTEGGNLPPATGDGNFNSADGHIAASDSHGDVHATSKGIAAVHETFLHGIATANGTKRDPPVIVSKLNLSHIPIQQPGGHMHHIVFPQPTHMHTGGVSNGHLPMPIPLPPQPPP